ncbi:MAG: ribosome-associated translation inhibitor RaiA [Candidatus Sungbacteria bacterium]|nr:ribosome-associated translation inhibitor RaiA [Candidatus Sungbacteria bacterium]
MRVAIRKKNLEITPALAEYIEKKILKPLKKLLKEVVMHDLPILDLEAERTTKHHLKGDIHRIEANLSLGKKFFRAEAEDQDIYAACDLVEKELEREISAEKGRMRSTALREERKLKNDLRGGGG